eukprot:1589557-Amphidinium_carterae.1
MLTSPSKGWTLKTSGSGASKSSISTVDLTSRICGNFRTPRWMEGQMTKQRLPVHAAQLQGSSVHPSG